MDKPLDPPAVVDTIAAALAAVGTPERAEQERAYLKSNLTFLGATMPATHQQARAFLREHPDLDRPALLALVDELWTRDVSELRMFAIELLERRNGVLLPADAAVLERLLRTSYTWAYVDSLAASVVGPLVERNPGLGGVLDRWAEDEDFWLRRSALLALLLPLRRGGGDLDRFLRYADAMLDEREFFIRKAIGWVLREVSRTRPEVVVDWLTPRVNRVSGVTLREAVRHLPAADRDGLMRAYKGRG
jgi:3-methyladenine DNA glycosylase AlkD